jgi:hypothetical protein
VHPLIRLPDAARNPVSIFGMAVATAAAVVFLALLTLELAGYLTNPYIGLLVFVAVPAMFLAGLLLIPIGAWWAARRRRRGVAAPEWPVIDLRDSRQRRILAGVAALTIGAGACTQHEQRIGTGAGVGAGLGAVTGALITGDAEGALLGAAAGGAAGAIIGAVTDRPGYCYARDPQGRTVVIECPPGY